MEGLRELLRLVADKLPTNMVDVPVRWWVWHLVGITGGSVGG